MRVVSNTSPISNLAIIGQLSLLREQFGSIAIPEAVAQELARLRHASANESIQQALAHGWLEIESAPPLSSALLASGLDPGEAEAISLAIERKADLVLLDERRARSAAGAMRLKFTGLLGVLLRAKLAGRIESLRVEIEKLRSHARFFVDPEVESRILSAAGEGTSRSL